MTTSPDHGTSLETRPSLLDRLKTGDDVQSWQEFYRIYGGLIRFFAQKAGLTADEAEEVVQETAIGVSRGLPEFVYNPSVCRFKTWLLNLTRWRIQNQLRKRPRVSGEPGPHPLTLGTIPIGSGDDTSRMATVERVPDPNVTDFGGEWDSAWERNLLTQAIERVRRRIDGWQFQAFDLYVSKQWPPADVARTLGVSVARIYLTKHRISRMLKKEIELLQRDIQRKEHPSKSDGARQKA